MKLLAAILILKLISKIAMADLSLNSELMQLEERKKSGQITAEDVLKIAEIYFLSSRCSEVKALFVYESKLLSLRSDEKQIFQSILCSCGGSCGKDLDLSESGKFIKRLSLLNEELLLVKSGRKKWTDKSMQKIWSTLEGRPEAAYLVLKALKGAPLKDRIAYAKTIGDLEAELDAYEVRN